MEWGKVDKIMKINIKLELEQFIVPNYVWVKEKPGERQDGFQESRKFNLYELDTPTLEELCEKFRVGVFKKARGGI